MQIGVIGVGLMGNAIMKKVAAPLGWDVDPSRCVNAQHLENVFTQCDCIFLCLPDNQAVQEILQHAPLREGHRIIDTSTGDPKWAEVTGRQLHQRGVRYLEATISGAARK